MPADATAAEAVSLRRVVQNALGHDFPIRFTYYPGSIPRGAGGKFEEFICLCTK